MSQLKRSKHLKIPLEEIKKATKNFEVCIGKGGYGNVYKGELIISGKPTPVAVKRLVIVRNGQGLNEFLNEIHLLSAQKHPNLIRLHGYCDEEEEKIIVYEYAERGSLDRYLRRDNATHTLTWVQRLKICIGAARGLNYLHNHVGKHQTVIHRDIKSANILIDESWVAKVSDLGLSKLISLNTSEVISNPCGTHGYCEPEYYQTNILTKQSDVYSFGMVLFEVLCGKLCIIKDDDGFMLSCSSGKKYFEEKRLDEIIDPSLKGEIDLISMNKFAAIAYRCLLGERDQRPTMDLVVKELRELLMKHQVSQSSGSNFDPEMEYISSNCYLKMESHSSNCYNQSLYPQFNFDVARLIECYYQSFYPQINFELARLKEKTHKIREPTLNLRRRFAAWRVFKKFDLDNDGALDRRELEALIHAIQPAIRFENVMYRFHIDNFYNVYEEYLDGEKRLTFSGFLLVLSFDEVYFHFIINPGIKVPLVLSVITSAIYLFYKMDQVLVPTTSEASGGDLPFLVHTGLRLTDNLKYLNVVCFIVLFIFTFFSHLSTMPVLV